MLLLALFISGVTVFFAARLAVHYARAVAAMKRLEEVEAAQLPPHIRNALSSRWASSWQSQVFHEIVIGDIAWAMKLSVGPTVVLMRRDARCVTAGFAGVFIVLLIRLFLSQ